MVKVDFGISKFAIVGMAGYIAPRHLDAIKNSECDLVAAHDVADSVGIMDRYFPHADFTTDADKFAGILKAWEHRLPDCMYSELSSLPTFHSRTSERNERDMRKAVRPAFCGSRRHG